jgi:hypothetical protein
MSSSMVLGRMQKKSFSSETWEEWRASVKYDYDLAVQRCRTFSTSAAINYKDLKLAADLIERNDIKI